jgi:hypothetical protein
VFVDNFYKKYGLTKEDDKWYNLALCIAHYPSSVNKRGFGPFLLWIKQTINPVPSVHV